MAGGQSDGVAPARHRTLIGDHGRSWPSACGSGGGTDDCAERSNRRRAAVSATPVASVAPTVAPDRQPATAAPDGRSQSPAAPPSTINWWHIQNNDPGKSLNQTIADEYMAAHPNVNDQHHGPRERGLQGQARDRRCRPATRPTSSSRGAAASSPSRSAAGLVKDITADIAPGRTR